MFKTNEIVRISRVEGKSVRPRVRDATVSAIDGLIYRGIHIVAEPHGVDARRARRGLGNDRPGCKSPGMDGAEFGNRVSVSGDDDGMSPPDFPKHGRRCIAKLTLVDCLVHGS